MKKIQKKFSVTPRDNQSLDLYLRDIAKLPRLTVDEEVVLAQRIHNGDEEAVSCQEEAIRIYKELGLYDPRGFDIDYEDAFGFLGQLYCYKGDYVSGIHYTTLALERALREEDCDFSIGLYYRRMGIAFLLTRDTQKARACFREAILCFERSSEAEPDPYTYPYPVVISSCLQLLSECDGPLHPDEYYWPWLI